jgi:NitT/TauT family transport system permease protein
MTQAGALKVDRAQDRSVAKMALKAPMQQQRSYALKVNGLRALLLVVGLLAWQLASGTIWTTFWISSPTEVAGVLYTWISTGELFKHVLATFQEMMLGFLAGTTVGAVAGFILGVKAGWYRVLQPFVDAFYTMPKLALGPLLIMWFGIDMGPKIGLITLMVFFFVFMNTLTGIRDVDPELVSVVRIMGADRWDLYRMVVLPSALTSILVGLKISIPYALLGAIVGELLVGTMGIGYLLNYARGTFDTKSLFAALVVTAVVAMAVNGLLSLYERSALRWKPANRGR